MRDIDFLNLFFDDGNETTSFILNLSDKIKDLEKIDENSINDLYNAKKKVEDLLNEIDTISKHNKSFETILRLAGYFSGSNLIDELNELEDRIDNKIENYRKTLTKIVNDKSLTKIVNDKSSKKDNTLNVTGDLVKSYLSQKIIANKKSNDKQTNQLCNIIADFLNTGEPLLKDTKEDHMKINAAANLLFGFADYTLHK